MQLELAFAKHGVRLGVALFVNDSEAEGWIEVEVSSRSRQSRIGMAQPSRAEIGTVNPFLRGSSAEQSTPSAGMEESRALPPPGFSMDSAGTPATGGRRCSCGDRSVSARRVYYCRGVITMMVASAAGLHPEVVVVPPADTAWSGSGRSPPALHADPSTRPSRAGARDHCGRGARYERGALAVGGSIRVGIDHKSKVPGGVC